MISEDEIEIKINNYFNKSDWDNNIISSIEKMILYFFNQKIQSIQSFSNILSLKLIDFAKHYLQFFLENIKKNLPNDYSNYNLKNLNLNSMLNQSSSSKISKFVKDIGNNLDFVNQTFYEEVLNLDSSQQLLIDISHEIINSLNNNLSGGFTIFQSLTNNFISDNATSIIIPVIKKILLKYLTNHYNRTFWSTLFVEIWAKIKYKNFNDIFDLNKKNNLHVSFIEILENLIVDQKFNNWMITYFKNFVDKEIELNYDTSLIEYIQIKIPNFDKNQFIKDVLNIIRSLINDSNLNFKPIIQQYLYAEIKKILIESSN